MHDLELPNSAPVTHLLTGAEAIPQAADIALAGLLIKCDSCRNLEPEGPCELRINNLTNEREAVRIALPAEFPADQNSQIEAV